MIYPSLSSLGQEPHLSCPDFRDGENVLVCDTTPLNIASIIVRPRSQNHRETSLPFPRIQVISKRPGSSVAFDGAWDWKRDMCEGRTFCSVIHDLMGLYLVSLSLVSWLEIFDILSKLSGIKLFAVHGLVLVRGRSETIQVSVSPL